MRGRFWLALALSTSIGSIAVADPQVTCDFIEIGAAKSKDGSIDPALGPVEKKLRKPPFSTQWTEFKKLSSTSTKLEKKKAEAIPLKQGSATATLLETVDKSGARLNVTIESPKGKKAVDNTSLVSANDYVIFTIVHASGDGHLVAVTCR